MAVFEITYEAKCKGCVHFIRTHKGRRVVHRCARMGRENLLETHPDGWPITLKRKACKLFKFY